MPGDRIIDIRAENGSIYRLLLHVPAGEPPQGGWPLLCLTDGNSVFALARDAMRIQAVHPSGTHVGPGVIAAIGYPTDEPYDAFRRAWDLSPPPGRSYPPYVEDGPPVLTGGAADFVGFIEDTLKPRIAQETAIDAQRQTLFGHSFGGLFALYALFTRPGTFQTYVAVSPSLYWEDAVIDTVRDPYLAACAGGPSARVLLSAGEYEGDRLPPFQREGAEADKRLKHLREIRTVALAADLAKRINAASKGRVQALFEVFAGENHMSVVAAAVSRGVQAAFSLDLSQQFEGISVPASSF